MAGPCLHRADVPIQHLLTLQHHSQVAFIKQEALEKAREIKVKADEEFAIEKVCRWCTRPGLQQRGMGEHRLRGALYRPRLYDKKRQISMPCTAESGSRLRFKRRCESGRQGRFESHTDFACRAAPLRTRIINLD